MSRLAALGVLLAALALLITPTTSPACACGPEPKFLVAHGTSPNGAPWEIRAEETAATRTSLRGAILHFSTSSQEGDSIGYFSGFSVPIRRGFAFHAVDGSGLYPELERDVSGYAAARARLVAKMSDGSRIEIETQRAPERLRQRFPWLRGLVFFDQFYAAAIEVQAITAYGRDGHVLAREPF